MDALQIMIEKQLKIINKLGLHARAAGALAQLAARFACHIEIEFTGRVIDAKSIMAVMMLAAAQGSVITVRCNGEDEQDAIDKIEALINDYFGEGG